MTVAEQLEQLQHRIVAGSVSGDDTEQELRALLTAFEHVGGSEHYRENIEQAISWAKVYASQAKASWRGPDRVRQFLVQHMTVAANWAKQLETA